MTPKASKRDRRQTNYRLSPALKAWVHGVAETRADLDGSSRLNHSKVVEDFLQYIKPMVDPATGQPRREAAVPATVIVMPTALPRFGHFFDVNQWAGDAELFRAMDRSFLMCRAADPDCACLHASKQLADFTGIHVSEFRGDGWTDAVHSDDRAECIAKCAREFQTRRSFELIYRLKCVYGSYSFVIDAAEPRWRPDGSFAGYIDTLHQVAPLRLSAGQLGISTRFSV